MMPTSETEWTPPPWCAVDRQALLDLVRSTTDFHRKTADDLARIEETGLKTLAQATRTNGNVAELQNWRKTIDARFGRVDRGWRFITHDWRVVLPFVGVATFVLGQVFEWRWSL